MFELEKSATPCNPESTAYLYEKPKEAGQDDVSIVDELWALDICEDSDDEDSDDEDIEDEETMVDDGCDLDDVDLLALRNASMKDIISSREPINKFSF